MNKNVPKMASMEQERTMISKILSYIKCHFVQNRVNFEAFFVLEKALKNPKITTFLANILQKSSRLSEIRIEYNFGQRRISENYGSL